MNNHHILNLSQEGDESVIAQALDQAVKELAHNRGDDSRSPKGLVKLLGLRES